MSTAEQRSGMETSGGNTALKPVSVDSIMASLRGAEGASSLAQLVVENPRAILQITNFAFEYPDLFQREKRVKPDLGEIRHQFPGVIASFDNERVREAFEENPTMSARLHEEREVLKEANGEDAAASVQDIELALKVLLEDGNPESLTGDDRLKVLSSYDAYVDLLESRGGLGTAIDRDEDRRFIQIGQALGRNMRAMDISEEALNKEPNLPIGDKDFRGRLGQIMALQHILGQIGEKGVPKATMDSLLGHLTSHAIALTARYPHRAAELRGKLNVGMPGTDRNASWGVEPGAMEMTQAEVTNTNHGGNG